MRTAGALLLVLALPALAFAQHDHWTEHLTADVEVVDVELSERRFGCGRAINYATVRARVVVVAAGEWDEPELRIAWIDCGSIDVTTLVGTRHRVTLRRWMHASEADLPVDRQPRWYVFDEATLP